MQNSRQQISPQVVDALLDLGRSGIAGTPDILQDADRAWHLLMIGDDPWRRWAADATDEHLRLAIKGLILYYQANERGGGSVSPVIPLYREFTSRRPGRDADFTDWILCNRTNGNEPFGTFVDLRVTSLQELTTYREEGARRRAERAAGERERKRRDGEAKADRATARLGDAVRRGDVPAVKALFEAGARIGEALPAGKSLLVLARENGRVSVL